MQSGSTYLQRLQYTYDADDRITGIVNGANAALTQGYTYDKAAGSRPRTRRPATRPSTGTPTATRPGTPGPPTSS
jgi:hypothetical protein